MKELISFSLKRRFFNSATVLLNILLCVLVSAALFADQIVKLINPTVFDDQKIYLQLDDSIEEILFSLEQEGLEFIRSDLNYKELLEKDAKAYVLYFDDGYKIASEYKLNQEIIFGIQSILDNVHQSLILSSSLNENEFELYHQSIEIQNTILQEDVQLDADKQNIVFMLITSIYFTMLSFSTSVANEVIYEKSTRQLELILTSVSAKTHFLSKMIIGWFVILIQALTVFIYIAIAAFVRCLYDEGKGLIQLINKLGLMKIEQQTILEFLKNIPLEIDFILKVFFILFFLMIGILLLQMVLVVISSFIANIEEAGNVQGPFYMILLGVYYFALSLNTPYQMSEGLGYVLSFFPFLSMLFMPCRLLIQNVNIIELSLSALISCVFMALILTKGSKIYQRGVLDYTSKGFLGVIKKTFGVS